MLPSRATGVGVGVCVGVGVGVGVRVAVGVAVGVRVAVGVGVGVGVSVGVAVAVDVGVGVGVVPCTSKEPLSIRPFTTRSKPGPRWSKNGGGVKFGSPASIAGLPGNSACVKVSPPLFCNGPSIGSVLIWSPGPLRRPAQLSLQRLYPWEITVPMSLSMFGPTSPLFRTVFFISSVPRRFTIAPAV